MDSSATLENSTSRHTGNGPPKEAGPTRTWAKIAGPDRRGPNGEETDVFAFLSRDLVSSPFRILFIQNRQGRERGGGGGAERRKKKSSALVGGAARRGGRLLCSSDRAPVRRSQVDSGAEGSMSTANGTRRASRRQSQDADKVVVNLVSTPPAAGSRRGVSTSNAGARTSPIDVEALEDEVQVVSASQVPPQRRNRRTRRQPVTVVDLDVHATRQGVSHDDNATVLSHNTRNKRPRVSPVINISPETGEGSSLQSKNAGKTSKEPLDVAPKEPIFTCPVCWNKLDEPATTMCGHIFCTNCIKQAIQFQKKCPTCRKHLKMNNFHRIYLPNTSR
ncbi:uncharacterized protein [Triticum aestivum]|uniref:uncharacterized protein isoform X3 n=1 Tax=Triticum aestivum TaxID=4565 RepID=UPI001D007940|nr:uncharacterized protein LOC123112543 isoform X3 [Triticum aestivum]